MNQINTANSSSTPLKDCINNFIASAKQTLSNTFGMFAPPAKREFTLEECSKMLRAFFSELSSGQFAYESNVVFHEGSDILKSFPPKEESELCDKSYFDRILVGTLVFGLASNDWKYGENYCKHELRDFIKATLKDFKGGTLEIKDLIMKFGYEILHNPDFDGSLIQDAELSERIHKRLLFLTEDYFASYKQAPKIVQCL